MLFHIIHIFFFYFHFFFFNYSFWTFFLWFSCSFPLTNVFSLDFLLSVAFTFWTPGGSRKGLIKLSVLLSFYPSFPLSGHFLEIVSLIFSKFWHSGRIPCEVVRDRAGSFRKIFFAPKIGNMSPKWAKNRVFWIYWKIGH